MTGRARLLHPAERKYLLDAARGMTAQQSARKYGVSLSTVNQGLKRGKASLNATTIAHATALCVALGEFTAADVIGH